MITKEQLIDRIREDILITCIAECPICCQQIDADNLEDTYLVLMHIREEHTIKELKEYLE